MRTFQFLVFVAFHMEYLGLGTAKLNWFDAFTEFYWIGGWFDFCQIISFNFHFHLSAPTLIHGARISGLEARMDQVEDRICDLDARGSEEADNLANDRDLDRFILTGNQFQFV